jgi:hypothetical protein
MEMGKSGQVAFILLFLGFFLGFAGYAQAGAIQKNCSFRQPTVDPQYNITPSKP